MDAASLKVLVKTPESLVVPREYLLTARDALVQGRAARRVNQPGTDADQVLVALRTSFGGNRAAIVLAFDDAGTADESALLERVAALGRSRPDAVAATAGQATDQLAGLPSQLPTDQPTDQPADQPAAKPQSLLRQIEPRTPAEPVAPVENAPAANEPGLTQQLRALGESAPGAAAEMVRAQGAALAALAGLLDHGNLDEALHAFCDGVAHSWFCQRVSVGIVRSGQVRVEAVSGIADFEKRATLITDIGEAMEETRLAASTVSIPVVGNDTPPRAHLALASTLKDPALLSLPLVDGERVVGVLLLERDYAFGDDERQRLEQLAVLIGPLVALKCIAALGSIDLARKLVQKPLAAICGPRHLTRKVLGAGALLLLVALATVDGTFRVGADARIEANVQRAVVSNLDSFLASVERRAGDLVQQGDVLARLDTEELRLEKIRWEGERDKLVKEYRATLAQRDRSNMRVIEARRDQAQTQIDLIDAQLSRAVMRAPIDGVVVSGDLSQMLGSPVERGQLLFEVASLDDYRLVLMVDESDIGWVEEGETGNLRLRSMPDESITFTVTSITPVSEPGAGANLFRVEAEPAGLPATLRPGMEGVAKIDIDERAVGWIWTRSFYQWLQLQLWRWGV